MRYLIIFLSLPAFAQSSQDWGRYANGYIAPPTLVEIQVIRTPDIRLSPEWVSPRSKNPHPDKVTKPSTRWFDQPPPQIGVNAKGGK